MKMTKSKSLALLSLLACAVASCQNEDKKDDKKAGETNNVPEVTPPATQAGGLLNLKFAADSQTPGSGVGLLAHMWDFGKRLGLTDSATVLGQSGIGKLKAAKFRVIDISLCASTDESKGDACVNGAELALYREKDVANDVYNTFVPSVAATYDGWTDFVDPTSTAKLAQEISYGTSNIAKYNKVIVHFYRSFKINAEVSLNDGRTAYTKSSTDFRDNGKSDLEVTYASASPSLLTGPSEDATLFLPNGGKTFYMQNPFEITAEDVAAKTAYKMLLAFDPDNLIKANQVEPSGAFSQQFLEGQIDTTSGVRITAPFIEFAPVVAKSSETIMRDTYFLQFSGTNPYAVRLSLYYVKEDTTKAVRAVTSNFVYTSDSTQYLNYNPLAGIRGITLNDDGTYKILQGSSSYVTIPSFNRHGEGTTGSGTQTYCEGSYDATTGCDGTTKTVDYVSTWVSSEVVDAPK
jgi:hypothetical protein